MNFATTKERILQYIEHKGISATNFFTQTGIKRGFLDSDKLKATVSDLFIAKIIATYEDINLYWLVTGKGKMMIEFAEYKQDVESEQPPILNDTDGIYENELIKSLKDTIEILKSENRELKDDKEVLKSVIKTKLGKANAS